MLKKQGPLFNRTYLKYLAFIVAIAIVFLAERPAKPLEQATAPANAISNLLVLKDSSIDSARLFLSFNANPALNTVEKVQRALDSKALQSAVNKSPYVTSMLWTYDRIELNIQWPKNNKTSLALIIDDLIDNSALFKTEKQRKLIAADQYIKNKNELNQLVVQLEDRLTNHYQRPESLNTILNKRPSTLLVYNDGDIITSIDKEIASLYPQERTPFSNATALTPGQHKIIQGISDYQQLIATELSTLSNRQNKRDLLANFALSQILSSPNTPQGIRYRLLRRPIFMHGYQLVILADTKPINTSTIDGIKESVERFSDSDLSALKTRLLEQYQQVLGSKERRYALYSKKIFYRLITESASEYEAQLDTIKLTEIKQHILKLLDKNQSFVINLQPS